MNHGHSFDTPRRGRLPAMHRTSGGTYPAMPVNLAEADEEDQREISVKLCGAVLKSAVDDALFRLDGVTLKQANLARLWIFSMLTEPPYLTFEDCCVALQVEPAAIRDRIIREGRKAGLNDVRPIRRRIPSRSRDRSGARN